MFNNFVDPSAGSIAPGFGGHNELLDKDEREQGECVQGIDLEKLGGDCAASTQEDDPPLPASSFD